jgi:hypothetical protein
MRKELIGERGDFGARSGAVEELGVVRRAGGVAGAAAAGLCGGGLRERSRIHSEELKGLRSATIIVLLTRRAE